MSRAGHARDQIISEIMENPELYVDQTAPYSVQKDVAYGLRIDDGVPVNDFGHTYDEQSGQIPLLFSGQDGAHGVFINIIGGQDMSENLRRVQNVADQMQNAEDFFHDYTDVDLTTEAFLYTEGWSPEEYTAVTHDDITDQESIQQLLAE